MKIPEIQWQEVLKITVQKHPLVLFRLTDEEWEQLQDSRNGPTEFTKAYKHNLLEGVSLPTPCIVVGKIKDKEQLCFGLTTSKTTVTYFETRVKVTRAVKILPPSENDLLQLIKDKKHNQNLKKFLNSPNPVVVLSPLLSVHLLEKLTSIKVNQGPMRTVAELLSAPTNFRGNDSLQEDAVQTALSAFGLDAKDKALSLDLFSGQKTALTRVNILEDAVIEHDARSIPGFTLLNSDLTGRAVFEKNNERLEVFTANKRPLEKSFGVDLIYLNISKKSIVMLQYKMLEPHREQQKTDWIYRPDRQLEKEIRRMKVFSKEHLPDKNEYRLNSNVFYLKFVKRDGSIGGGSIITPLDHFELIRNDESYFGPNGGLRISFEKLNGQYLRQTSFLDLLSAGYIGSYSERTRDLKVLIDQILKGNRSIVAAIQQPLSAK